MTKLRQFLTFGSACDKFSCSKQDKMEISSKELNNLLSKAKHILILGPEDPSIDVVSTAAAWQIFLRAQGKMADICLQGKYQVWNFFPNDVEIKKDLSGANKFQIILNTSQVKVKQLSYDLLDQELRINILPDNGNFASDDVKIEKGSLSYDLVLTLGVNNLENLGQIFAEHRQFFHHTTIINIDRSILNENFAQLNIVELNSTSLAEISYHFFQDKLNKDLATCLLAGIISATNSFQSPLVTPELLEIASSLIVSGAERQKIIESLYRTKDIMTLKNWGRILSRLKQKGQVIYSHLEHADIESLPQDFQELVKDLILSTPNTRVAIIFYQVELEITEAWLYGIDNVNVLDLVRDLNPQGSKSIAKININLPLDKARDVLVARVDESSKLLGVS